MLTGAQIRSARAMLNWTVADLAKNSGVGVRTILRMEATDDVPQSTTGTLHKIRNCLVAAGIEFIGTPEDAPGIRIHKRQQP